MKARPTILIVFVIFNFLLLVGGLHSLPNYAATDDDGEGGISSQVANGWLDFRSIFSDVGVFVITGILTVIAIQVSRWANNNSKWKEERETFENKQTLTNQNIANAIKLIVDDLKQYRETNSKEIDEIRTDYKSVNNKAIQTEERIKSVKEDLTDIKEDIRSKKR